MQLVDGEVTVTKVLADRLKDPDLYDKIGVDKALVDLIGTIEKTIENSEGELELVPGEALEELQGSNQVLHEELRKSVDREKKWKLLVEEAVAKEEEMREQMLKEQEQKISQLQAQWIDTLAEKDASTLAVSDDDKQGQYQTVLAEQLEKEKSSLRLQMEEEQSKKLLTLETSWKTLLEERDNKLQETQATLEATLREKEALCSKMDEAEKSWKVTITEMEETAQKEKEEIESQIEERLKISAETVAVELGEALQGRLDEMKDEVNISTEKEALRVQLNEEKEQELVAVETTWKATLHEVEEKAEKEKEDIQVLLGEGEVLKQKVEEIEVEKQSTLDKLEEEAQAKMAEVEAKWQDIFREATGKAVHIGSVDDAKAVIAELIQEKEREHGDIIRQIEDAHLSEKTAAEAKFLEQERMVNEMLGKLEKLESREVDVRQQFNTSAAKVESQLRPLRQKEVCTVARDLALSCYSENSTKPLRCSEAVMKYMQCVDAERIALLQRNAAS